MNNWNNWQLSEATALPLADLGEAPWHVAPTTQNFLNFMRFLEKLFVGAPLKVDDPYGDSWIRPCLLLRNVNLFRTGNTH